jgi:elongation factor P--(R)-beta-lysine ligase
MTSPQHTPLHQLAQPALIQTGGRILEREGALWIVNAHAALPAHWPSSTPAGLKQGALVRVEARWDGAALHVSRILDVRSGRALAPSPSPSPAQAMEARARLYAQLGEFFAARGFMEVMTPAWVAEPGTDIYLNPFAATFSPEGAPRGDHRHDIEGWLHTSPEFAMKRLLVEGFERIWQRCPAWRNGEVSARHAPEFTIVEWYRAWESIEAIMDDVEALVRLATGGVARLATGGSIREIDLRSPFKRLTMQQLVARSCAGLDLLAALDYESLRAACQRHGLLPHRVNQPSAPRPQTGQLYALRSTDQPIGEDPRWAELFFELQVTHIDPALEHMGAVFITDWPAPLAVLAARDPKDPRVAKRFELYVGGLELTNGFEELTDAREQRARFAEDLRARAQEDMAPLPMPERFLAALEQGMPPSAGVALGLDRLLMLAIGAPTLQHVCPQALRRDAAGDIDWG